MGRPKSSLTNSGILSYNKKCLIVCSKNVLSSALLYLIKSNEIKIKKSDQSSMKNSILYINDNDLISQNSLEHKEIINNLTTLCNDLNYNGYFVSLKDYIFKNKLNIKNLKTAVEELNLGQVANPKIISKEFSYRNDIITKLRIDLIVLVAKILQCNTVYMDICSNDVAAMIISNTSLGHGPCILFHEKYIKSNYRNIRFIYPLHKITQEEINNYFQTLKIQNFKENHHHQQNNASIQAVSTSFMEELDTASSSTISTICKIIEKLKFDKSLCNSHIYCRLCDEMASLKPSSKLISAELAKNFSFLVSLENVDFKTDNELFNLDKNTCNYIYFKQFTHNDESINRLDHYIMKSNLKMNVCCPCYYTLEELNNSKTEPNIYNEELRKNVIGKIINESRNCLINCK